MHAQPRFPESDQHVDLWVDADHLTDPDRDPVRIDWIGSSGVCITGHTGLYAADICRHVVAVLPDPHLRAWLDGYGAWHVTLDHVRRDPLGALQPWLWLPVQRRIIPPRLRWPGA
ncbi:hypothetical protein [Streptomonospora wellingtoniae]|uniref:Uncharacterized protein n=1 Tax=Streptomonospora wellingtoniae TaxID=3075544 RepID=A0ABU2KUN0_9ACTN|nr:hypothetical protein [Streptomonospora sp. DSM 45055]MDT0302967.1 hypothetical protein [Streptomonospora sp. DSM 45055]